MFVMKYQIKIKKTTKSRLGKVDFDKIPFGKTFSDHMFLCDFKKGQWVNPRIVPFKNLTIHPANLAIHYGQSVFEGMKASKMYDGTPALLRPEQHVRRINASAARLCMPSFPEALFLEALETLVDMDRDWIPPTEGSALYIRPFMFAQGDSVGVRPSDDYTFAIITGPVGPYYTKPVKLKVETKYVRAVDGGTGEAKAAGNYAGSLLPARLAQQEGFDQVIWMDAFEFKYIQEVGTMNLFFVIDNVVVTPDTDGSILKGITRDTFIQILKDRNIKVETRKVSIDEIVAAYEKGTLQEAFGAGTAAVVSDVESITYRDLKMMLPPVEGRKISKLLFNTINGLRSGKVKDTFGWVKPIVGELVEA
jgi:branched-chain amino acid aminotransferase